jgi:hypothetical protein
MWDPEYIATVQASTACYGDSFIALYVYGVLISQQAHL